jgi:hypothetical protein
MTVFVNTEYRIMAGAGDIAGFANQIELMVEQNELDFTTLNSGGWFVAGGGLVRHSLNVSGLQSFAADGVDALIGGPTVGRQAFTVCPRNFGNTLADPCYLGHGWDFGFTPLSGSVGEVAGFSTTWTGDNRLARGQVLHPLAARTSTANGTTTTFTNPTATQALAASFHVTSVSGAGSIVFTVQTDDNSGMSSAVTRITSQSFTGTGSEFARLAPGAFSGETHIRTAWTITGFTSVTFLVAAGVA